MYRVYVGNLDSEVTEAILNDVLRQRSVSSTAVVVKRGYAFVDCPDAVSFDHAIQQLDGTYGNGNWLLPPSRRSRADSEVVRMDPLRFLAGCRTRRLNQA